jgi:hypothetical protein
MKIEGAFRIRVLYAVAVFGGVAAGLIGTFMLMGQLSVPRIYAAFGAICGVPVAAVLWREVGAWRALALALVTAAGAALLMLALGQGMCALSSCAR